MVSIVYKNKERKRKRKKEKHKTRARHSVNMMAQDFRSILPRRR